MKVGVFGKTDMNNWFFIFLQVSSDFLQPKPEVLDNIGIKRWNLVFWVKMTRTFDFLCFYMKKCLKSNEKGVNLVDVENLSIFTRCETSYYYCSIMGFAILPTSNFQPPTSNLYQPGHIRDVYETAKIKMLSEINAMHLKNSAPFSTSMKTHIFILKGYSM